MPELVVKLGDKVVQKYYFDKEIISMGRARDNDIVVENLSVSRNHSRIRKDDEGKYIITDLNSANGTYVNNVRINKTELMDDDIISIGKHQIHFHDKSLSDEQLISDAFGAERTMIVDKTPTARLLITKGKQADQEFKIGKNETYIGRSSDNDIRIHDWFVSKKHAMILKEGSNYFLKDLKSWRGTMVNGKFTRETQIKDGDSLQFGSTVMEFHVSAEDEMLQIGGRVPKELEEESEEYVSPEEFSEIKSSAGEIFEEEEDTGEEPSEEQADIKTPDVSENEEESVEEKPEEQDIAEEDFEEQMKREEEEVAKMQAAWESLDEEEQVKEEPDFQEPSGEEMEEAGAEALASEEDVTEKTPEESEEVEEISTEKPEGEEIEVPEDLPEGVDPKIVKVWLKALNNPSPVIRKNAAKFLKKLTGKEYKYE